MQSITLPQQLTAIECYDGKTYYKDCTIEYATKFKQFQFHSLDNSIVTGSNIRSIRNATSLEFYEQLILPGLPQKDRELFVQIRANITDKLEKELKLDQILSAMDRKKKEENYYKEASRPLTEEELARRKEQVRNRKRLTL